MFKVNVRNVVKVLSSALETTDLKHIMLSLDW